MRKFLGKGTALAVPNKRFILVIPSAARNLLFRNREQVSNTEAETETETETS
jgi:hypothetical protein